MQETVRELQKDVYDITKEVLHLKVVRDSGFGKSALEPIELLNRIYENGFASLYPNVTVASRERSFSKLAIIENPKSKKSNYDTRKTEWSGDSIECELARKIDLMTLYRDLRRKGPEK